jgi:hypothetical protein
MIKGELGMAEKFVAWCAFAYIKLESNQLRKG